MNYKEELQKIYTKEIPEYSTEFLNNEFILYGAGSLGSMAVDLLEKRGLRPEYIVDKSAKGNIKGIKIISPEEIPDIDKLVLKLQARNRTHAAILYAKTNAEWLFTIK